MLNIQEHFKQKLAEIYEEDELSAFFYILLEKIHGLKRVDFILQPKIQISEEQKQRWEEAMERLSVYEPIQYITNEAWFFGRSFYVAPAVLIPRPETEELVAWIIEEIKNKTSAPYRILEIGTGSGCIPISIKAEGISASVEAWDISEKALEIAVKNTIQHQVEVAFKLQDVFTAPTPSAPYHLIVSNPPYVRVSEKEEMKPNVLAYEPALALFVSHEDPLVFYREIGYYAHKNLVDGGLLFFEINQYLGEETISLLTEIGFSSVELRKDFRGNHRMLKAVKNYS